MNPILRKYEQRVEAIQSLLCIGLDPVITLIPERFLAAEFPLFKFNKWIIDQTAPCTAAYKPNSAFYEGHGAKGIIQLELTVEYLRSSYPEIVTICDAKRGDNSNTNKSYVEAIFDRMNFDCVTLHPYLGQEALAPFLDRRDKACIILCRTSNPGAAEFQDILSNGHPLWQTVADHVANKWDVDGNCMLVVGATYPDEMRRIRAIAPNITFLVPGVGAQGGDIAAVLAAGLNADGRGLIISSSREIIYSSNPATAAAALRDVINAAKEAINAAR
jgi:orotidine-5'-phosphate decarboxylase